jgi:hypothetical protein
MVKREAIETSRGRGNLRSISLFLLLGIGYSCLAVGDGLVLRFCDSVWVSMGSHCRRKGREGEVYLCTCYSPSC